MESGKGKKVGIIPARGGSKRVPRKNIKLLDGKPLIVHTIEHALASKMLDIVVVSTEDEEIATVAREAGADVPFMRESKFAADQTSDLELFQYLIPELNSTYSVDMEVLVNLRPTSPFRTAEDIDNVLNIFAANSYDSVRSVCQVHGVWHPYWMYTKNDEGLAGEVIEGISVKNYYQSQLLPPVYRLNGMVDVMKVQNIMKHDLYGKDMYLYETPELRSLDIDTLIDFEYAEFLIQKGNV